MRFQDAASVTAALDEGAAQTGRVEAVVLIATPVQKGSTLGGVEPRNHLGDGSGGCSARVGVAAAPSIDHARH